MLMRLLFDFDKTENCYYITVTITGLCKMRTFNAMTETGNIIITPVQV